MSNHTFLPKKKAIVSVYEALGIDTPHLPKIEEFGWKRDEGKFIPTEQDMQRRLIFLLDHLSATLKKQINH